MSEHTRPNACADCGGGSETHRRRRGLCFNCYSRHRYHGTLEQFPPMRNYWARAELLSEWDHLRRSGVSMAEAAPRLGVTRKAIEKAIERERRAVA
jgi:hypothetical protein